MVKDAEIFPLPHLSSLQDFEDISTAAFSSPAFSCSFVPIFPLPHFSLPHFQFPCHRKWQQSTTPLILTVIVWRDRLICCYLQFKDEYKQRNAELESSNEQLRCENEQLFSAAVNERDSRIAELENSKSSLVHQVSSLQAQCGLESTIFSFTHSRR